MNEPIKLKSNEFWGKRSGSWSNKTTKRGWIYGWIFKGKRASTVKKENQGGVGRKARRIRKYRSKRS